MALFEWNDKYSVGVNDMDNQHKKLFAIINELFDAMRDRKSNEVLGKILKDLLDYTIVHFGKEEQLMKQNNYPGLQEQLTQHKIFTDKIKELADKHNSGKMVMSIEISSFLKDWLVNHIQGIDKKYHKFFNDKGIK
jgi:hemerythrin